MDAFGLRARGGVGERAGAVEAEPVARSGPGRGDADVVAVLLPAEANRLAAAEDELDDLGTRRPYPKARPAAAEVGGAMASPRLGPLPGAQRRPLSGVSATTASGGQVSSSVAAQGPQAFSAATAEPSLPTPEPP